MKELLRANREKYIDFLKSMIAADSTDIQHGFFGNERNAQQVVIRKLQELGMQVDVFEPDMEQNRIYRRLYEEVFKNIYGRLSGLYERLQEIYQEEEDKIMI